MFDRVYRCSVCRQSTTSIEIARQHRSATHHMMFSKERWNESEVPGSLKYLD